jgi:hypothetical protein
MDTVDSGRQSECTNPMCDKSNDTDTVQFDMMTDKIDRKSNIFRTPLQSPFWSITPLSHKERTTAEQQERDCCVVDDF